MHAPQFTKWVSHQSVLIFAYYVFRSQCLSDSDTKLYLFLFSFHFWRSTIICAATCGQLGLVMLSYILLSRTLYLCT